MRLRSSSRARTPGPSHSCAGGSELEAVCDVRRSRAIWTDRRQGETTGTGKGKGCAGGSGKGNGYGEDTGSKGYIRGKGKPAEEPLVGHGHQKYRVACINLGGLKKRIRYVYEWNMWNMPADLILCWEVDEVMYEQMTNKVQKWNPANSPEAVQQPPQGFAEELRSIWLGTSSSTAIYVRQVRKRKKGEWSRVLAVRAKWHHPVCDRMEAFVAVFQLHNTHAKVDGEPRRSLYASLAECCAGGCRIIAGDMNMAFLETDPRNRRHRRAVASRCKPRREEHWIGAVTVGLVRYMVSGQMTKPGTCVSMTTHSKYGMYHPFALDGNTENRGYIAAYYNKAYQTPLAEDVIDEAAIREYSNFLRERMQIYESVAALAAHMPGLIPKHAVHAAARRFE